MCYRCHLCQTVVPPKQPLRRHVVYRDVPGPIRRDESGEMTRTLRREIEREIPVCPGCARQLEKEPLKVVARRNWRPRLKGIPDSRPVPILVNQETQHSRPLPFLGESVPVPDARPEMFARRPPARNGK